MMLKQVQFSPPSCLKQHECEEDVSELRQKLSSVGWVQCDNLHCLKWRQVSLEVLQHITEDTPWTCNMNEDGTYNRCSIPEEDTSCYEKLAKRVKLDVITSRLKSGALVWAKVQGYCRWPALITADPLNGEHTDEDDFEAVQYHVEFLGDKRSHGWIKAKSIEVFGPGNIDSAIVGTYSSQVPTGRAKKFNNLTSVCRVKHKDTSHKVRKAIEEALQLLPLPLEARLKTCQFVTLSDVNRRSITDDSVEQLAKMTSTYNLRTPVAAQESGTSPLPDSSSMAAVKYSWSKLCCQQEVHNKNSSHTRSFNENRTQVTRRTLHSVVPSRQLQVVSDNKLGVCQLLSAGVVTDKRKPPDFLLFSSSLIGSSKQGRFMEDVQMYQHYEQVFEQELTLFNARYGLTQPQVPTWKNIQISKYGLFLAVLDRDGFLRVCDKHQWSCVYAEITNLYCRQGAGLCKQYYQRNLYPFEVYIGGHDCTTVVHELDTCVEKHPRKSPGKEAGDSGVDTDDLQTTCADDGFDSPNVIRHLDELDEILRSLNQGEQEDQDNTAEAVPPSCVPIVVKNSDDALSSQKSPDIQVLHEMQALQYDLDFLQDEIDLL